MMASNPKLPGSFTWTTLDEIQFLRKLGSHTEVTRLAPLDKKKRRQRLLEGAKEAYSKRVRWGKIDKAEVLKYLSTEG